jgi:signal transduction histidine kinase
MMREGLRWGRPAPWLAAIGIALCVPVSLATLSGVFPNNGGWLGAVVILAVVAWGGTGWLLGTRRAENPIGLIMAAEAFVLGYVTVQSELYLWRPEWPVSQVLQDTQGDLVLMFLAVPLVLLLFPTGRPPTRRWTVVLWLMACSVATGLLGMGLAPEDPIPWSPLASTLTQASAITGLLAAALSIAAVIVRFRRSQGDEREQMRWLALIAIFGGAFFVATVVAGIAAGGNENNIWNVIFFNLFVLTITVGLPAAIGRAVLRYRLYDIDVVIKKTLVALVLAFIIGLAGIAAFALAGQVALWEGTPKAVSVAIGLVFGVLLLPVVRLSRRIADRLVYGRRATPYEVLASFSGRVGEAYSSDDVLPRMAQILAAGTGASSARVLVRVGGDLLEAAGSGEPNGEEHVEPIVFQGEDVGALAVTFPANDPIDQPREQLIVNLAAQAGPVVRNVRLIEELRASRQRLVAAQDEERRKLERNIHDGVQQQLVALNVQLGLLGRVTGPGKAAEMASDLQVRTGEALEDLRDLARGIYPPLLADKGLAAALESQARKAVVPTTVDADGVGRFSQAIESTVYFSCLEALQNVAKYAEATRATISLSNGDGLLQFAVTDDGRGFDLDATSQGTGLQGIADRLAAIGGSVEIVSAPGAGTTIGGSIPIEATP